VELRAEPAIVPPNSFALARSVEYFQIPSGNIPHYLPIGQSTYAPLADHREYVTPFEPELGGPCDSEDFHSKTNKPLPARIDVPNEGLAYVLFFGRTRPSKSPTAELAAVSKAAAVYNALPLTQFLEILEVSA